MRPVPSTLVRGLDGLHGTVDTTSCPSGDTASQVAVKLDDGRTIFVPENQLILQADETYYVPLSLADLGVRADESSGGRAADGLNATTAFTSGAKGGARTVRAGEEVVIPRVEERLQVGTARRESAVRVRKTVSEREEVVDVPLLREAVDVERVAVNRVVEAAPGVRHEGDVMVVPVLEEVLVVEKRLMLREELRITRRTSEVREPQRVTLRSEHIEVTRDSRATAGTGAGAEAAPGVK